MEYDQAIRRRELLIQATTRMDFSDITLSEKTISKGYPLYVSTYITFTNDKAVEVKISGCQSWRKAWV